MTHRIALIGGGITSAVGRTHITAARMDGRFEIAAAVFSSNPDTNRASAEAYGVAVECLEQDWESLLSARAKELDAIVVLTPTPAHKPLVVAALHAGLHVICEKSLSTSSRDAQEIIEVSRARERRCLVTYNYTGYPAVREMRRRVFAGDLGAVSQICIEMPQETFLRQGVIAQRWRTRDYELPTVSLDLGVHVIHLAQYLAPGLQVSGIASTASHSGSVGDVIDSVHCLLSYTGGATGNYWWSKTALGHRNGLRVRIFGSRASLEWYQMQPEELHMSHSDGRREIIDRGQAAIAGEMAEERYSRFKAGHPAGFLEAFANLYTDFSDVLAGEADAATIESYDAAAAASGLELLEAIHARANTHGGS